MFLTIVKKKPKPYFNQTRWCTSSRKPFAVQHLSPGIGRITDIELVSGQGSWVTDTHGKKYLDFTSGIGVTNLGHCHPRVVRAIQEQAGKLIHAQINVSWHKPMLDLIEKFRPFVPKNLDSFFFSTTGAEAVEASIKLARHATKKQHIIVFNGGFHGRSFGTMSMTTTKTIYRSGYGPLLPGIFVNTFPYYYHSHKRYGDEYTEEQCVKDALEDLEILLKTQTSPSETAAFLIEPVLGEGGYIPAHPLFLQGLREMATKHQILLIADEVQSGIGRTGRFWAYEHSYIKPDIVVFAKGIASGMPLSGIFSSQELMSHQSPGSMGGTYAGNAVSCSAAIATLDVFKEEEILNNVQLRGQHLRKRLDVLKKKYDFIIGDVRGLGLMVGIEFKNPQPLASVVSKKCYEKGLLLLTCSVFDTLRFIPPLNVSESEIEEALKIFEDVLKQLFLDRTY